MIPPPREHRKRECFEVEFCDSYLKMMKPSHTLTPEQKKMKKERLIKRRKAMLEAKKKAKEEAKKKMAEKKLALKKKMAEKKKALKKKMADKKKALLEKKKAKKMLAKKAKKAKKAPKKAAKKPIVPKKAKKAVVKMAAAPPAALLKKKALSTKMAGAPTAAGALDATQAKAADVLYRAGSTTHKWQYMGDNGKWQNYEHKASLEVEKAFASWCANPHIDVRSVKSGDWHYMVDFNLMEQTNIQHPNHKQRKIQRIPISQN